jgi:hypothetical protein
MGLLKRERKLAAGETDWLRGGEDESERERGWKFGRAGGLKRSSDSREVMVNL